MGWALQLGFGAGSRKGKGKPFYDGEDIDGSAATPAHPVIGGQVDTSFQVSSAYIDVLTVFWAVF